MFLSSFSIHVFVYGTFFLYFLCLDQYLESNLVVSQTSTPRILVEKLFHMDNKFEILFLFETKINDVCITTFSPQANNHLLVYTRLQSYNEFFSRPQSCNEFFTQLYSCNEYFTPLQSCNENCTRLICRVIFLISLEYIIMQPFSCIYIIIQLCRWNRKSKNLIISK